MSDRWARCLGFPAYEVSARGVVRRRHTKSVVSAWPNDQGYLYVKLQRAGQWFKRRVHKLVYEAHKGRVPIGKEVDHRNRKRDDPKLRNLRAITHGQNVHNTPSREGTTSRYKGVTWCKARELFQAQIKFKQKVHFLGRFKSERKAGQAYDDAARRMFGKFAVTNFGRK